VTVDLIIANLTQNAVTARKTIAEIEAVSGARLRVQGCAHHRHHHAGAARARADQEGFGTHHRKTMT
jgi:hypothetical protein